MKDSRIVVVGANPAWQRVVSTGSIVVGEVVRVRRTASCPAGKGLNCAQALRRLGGTPVLIGGSGGGSGPLDGNWESACRDEEIETLSFPLDGPVRIALTVFESSSGSSTELVEEGPSATPGSETLLALHLASRIAHGSPLVVCGSFPSGISPEVVAKAWNEHPVELVVDSLPLLRVLSLPESHPRAILKLNRGEWAQLLGDLPLEDLLVAAQERWPGAEIVATLGKDGCVARRVDGIVIHRHPDPLPSGVPLHPIGAGDAFTAALGMSLIHEDRLERGLLEGLAVSRASCLHPLPGRFHPQDLAQARNDLHVHGHP